MDGKLIPAAANVCTPVTAHSPVCDAKSQDGDAFTGRHASGDYQVALDGLRAFAVISVLLYHAEMAWLPGGFLGVEVFFVLSGYLVTSLLLTEATRRAGVIDLCAFWSRRCRRLVPALTLTVVAVLGYASVFLPVDIVALRMDAAAALSYTTNWYLIFKSASYFDVIGRPSLLQHCWSLAVEGQFYVIWPVLVAICARRFAPVVLAVVTLAGVLLSFGLMLACYDGADDPSRLYYGSDTRAAGLLIGALTAQIIPLRKARRSSRLVRRCRSLSGLVACAWLVWLMCVLDERSVYTFQGGILSCALAVAVLITVLVRHRGAWTVLFSNSGMQWLGTRSYGIYLWHWPIYCLTRPDVDLPLSGTLLLLLRIGLTLTLAALSFRWLETPIRQYGFRWLLVGVPPRRKSETYTPVRIASLFAALALVTSLGLTVATATPPPLPEELAVLVNPAHMTPDIAHDLNIDAQATRAVTTLQENEPVFFLPVNVVRPASGQFSSICCMESGLLEHASTALDHPVPPQTLVDELPRAATAERTILLFGDSVMLGAAAELTSLLGGAVRVDAVVGRQVDKGIEALGKHATAGSLGSAVVIHLGTNGTFTFEQMTSIMAILGQERQVFLLTARVPRRWESSVNETIRRAAVTWNNVKIIDWHTESRKMTGVFGDDGVHLKPKGRKAYAKLIHDGLVSAP